MHALHGKLIPTVMTIAIGAAAVIGCASNKPATSSPETTGATVWTNDMSNRLNEVQRERDSVVAQLAQERTTREAEHHKYMQEAAIRKEHDDLELRMTDALEKSGVELTALREKAAKATAKQKKEIEKATEEAKQHKAKLYADFRRLHGDLGNKPWESFRTEVHQTIAELDRVIADAKTSMDAKKPNTSTGTGTDTTTMPPPLKDTKAKEEK